jgi:hypothetical protein
MSQNKTNKIFSKRGDNVGIKTGEPLPKSLVESKYFSRDLLDFTRGAKAEPVLDVSEDVGRIEKREAERGYVKKAYKDAYWTETKTKQDDGLGAKIGQMKAFWRQGKQQQYNTTRSKVIEILDNINSDIEDWVDEIDENIADQQTKDDIFDKVEDKSIFWIDGNYQTIDFKIPQWNDADTSLRIFKDEDEVLPPHKAVAKAPAKAVAPAKVGKGLPTSTIDFEDINWGSLTEQMKAYNSQHSKDFDLEGFARMIIADPSKFQKRTLKRARFYINVLLPKKK